MPTAQDVIAVAQAQIGDAYVFGAGAEPHDPDGSPSTFDCSSLVQYAFEQGAAIYLPRTTFDQVGCGDEIPQPWRANVAPADLIFSSWDGVPHSHVGLYAGDGQIIVAPEPGETVQRQTLDSFYWDHVDAVRRLPLDAAEPAATPEPEPAGGGRIVVVVPFEEGQPAGTPSTLSGMAQMIYGDAGRWPEIWDAAANASLREKSGGSPDLIFPGDGWWCPQV